MSCWCSFTPDSCGQLFSEYRGTNGPLTISRLRSNSFVSTILQSASELGFKMNDDYNGESQEGMIVWITQFPPPSRIEYEVWSCSHFSSYNPAGHCVDTNRSSHYSMANREYWSEVIKKETEITMVFSSLLLEESFLSVCCNSFDSGFSPAQYTVRDQDRASTNRAYLYHAMRRPNLHVVTDAQVIKVRMFMNFPSY